MVLNTAHIVCKESIKPDFQYLLININISKQGTFGCPTQSFQLFVVPSSFAGVTLPPIDPWALLDLEGQARVLSQNVNGMLSKLDEHVKEMSTVSAECVDIYRNGVDSTCDAVDLTIKVGPMVYDKTLSSRRSQFLHNICYVFFSFSAEYVRFHGEK